MMTSQIGMKENYIRANAELAVLDSSVVARFDESRSGYLNLLTDDGRLRLTITRNVAEDLVIDLQQFLKGKPLTAAEISTAIK